MTVLIRALTLILMLIDTPVAAQPWTEQDPDKHFVCVEKSDAYKLALADMQGTLKSLAKTFAVEGMCAFLPAVYLFTIDPYLDSAGKPSRVVEMTAYGERVWGISGSLPDGVWLISHH